MAGPKNELELFRGRIFIVRFKALMFAGVCVMGYMIPQPLMALPALMLLISCGTTLKVARSSAALAVRSVVRQLAKKPATVLLFVPLSILERRIKPEESCS